MTDRKKFKERVRARMRHTGESYMTAERNLAAGVPEPTQDVGGTTPSAAAGMGSSSSDGAVTSKADAHRKSRQRFRSSTLDTWKSLTSSIAGGQHRVEWTDPLQIVAVLNSVGREARHNHVHFPTHGGLDLHSAALGAEAGCLELNLGGHDSGGPPYITRPVRLVLNVMKNDPLGEWTFFWYETAPLVALGIDLDPGDLDPTNNEELLELRPREYVTREHWDAGYYEHDEYGREVPLPHSARLVRRHLFGGPFLIVSKGSSWNASPHLGDYRGGHAKRPESEFAKFVQAMVDELHRRGHYGVDPRGL